ncbi:bifunctional diaminohydroxyphosphoribosylaminopyrimidine deaminase/5-amino-6-(5-phosphoribosylamino)uracil reductase RibD [Acidisphaera sp. L21]|uniref:bifunctional diaminohydroxyphosphoribosylaminopyrimidine deaminase/5-amino-6-(5-phosphoribosylamino)uracil reductase RibD n=1 Tax=Acidisphaera sp. L21 TaxID=1641851 RepID=UPI00131E4121|nr:bifunctional diaminohydroxyphosphoribosylaminopyrimidine deaminase/5-amino-6-(5-phosphoribosylamino)uracil reductase RibD [Acidisphaera sp. L21]
MVDPSHMRAALALARRGLGNTWPNPSVGCVIVQYGQVVGRGVTQPGGRPHAETQALAMAGEAARGADAYVTLEPCNHTGQTPPCTEALVAAGVARVVIAGNDPDPRVDGAGIARLRAAGIEVVTGVLTAQADEMQAGFLCRVQHGRPLVTLKLATTLDGKIATRSGESQWITGASARAAAHALRGQHDAVLVGVGTVAADNPSLTCRIVGFRSTPVVRVVVDSHLRTRLTARLIATATTDPTWIIHRGGVPADRQEAFSTAGVRMLSVAGGERGVDLAAGLQALGAAGLTRVLVEGGAQIAAGLLRDGLVDRIAWFHAPGIMGGDGWPAAQAFGVTDLSAMPRFTRTSIRAVGDDMLTEFSRAA